MNKVLNEITNVNYLGNLVETDTDSQLYSEVTFMYNGHLYYISYDGSLVDLTDEKDIKIFHKYIILPYLNNIQTNNNCAEDNLSKSIDKYFEYKNEKHKTKFINLIKNIVDDYPMWNLHGYSKREEKCQN